MTGLADSYELTQVNSVNTELTRFGLWEANRCNAVTVVYTKPVLTKPNRWTESRVLRFYVIEPNEPVLINSIIKSKAAIFEENRFSSVPRPCLGIPNETKDIGGSVVPEEDDPKTFDEEMKSQDVAFWKEAINDEIDSIMGNNTWVLVDLPPG
ncbi:hypothetical protein Tco_1368009 [Tanacetum coccineum]